MKINRFSLPLLVSFSLLLSGCTLPGFDDKSSQSSFESSSQENSESSSSATTSSSSTSSFTSSSLESSSSEEDTNSKYKIANPNMDEVIRNSKEEVTYDDLFNLNNKISIELTVDREEMEKIADDNSKGPKPEMYRLAKNFKLTMVNGDNTFVWELENVGIRQKGNTSRGPIFYGDILNTCNHYKIKFDETFTDTEMYDSDFIATHGNAEYEDREFLGLNGLDFKWDKNYDLTHVKEKYVNDLYRAAGIITQHVGLSKVKINYGASEPADFGLCYIYEQSNKDLIKRSLQSDTSYINMSKWKVEKDGTYGIEGKKYGDLYKVTYGHGNGSSSTGGSMLSDTISGNKVGVKTDIYGNNLPAYERKTNNSETYDDHQLKNTINLLNKSNCTFEQLEEVIDMDYLAMEEAVTFIVGNPDSLRNNYNNYQIYIRRTDGKMVIIPIDNDRALGIGRDWVDGLNFVLRSDNKKPLYKNTISGEQRNPLMLKTILASSSNQAQEDYLACIDLIKASPWVKEESFNLYYNAAKKTYSDEYEFNAENPGYDNISFLEAINKERKH